MIENHTKQGVTTTDYVNWRYVFDILLDLHCSWGSSHDGAGGRGQHCVTGND